ncbi:MAG: nucleoside hydrolase [Eubacteriales bacterium]|nr:nucleoside hydrolase [Eubacteriales bacterium]
MNTKARKIILDCDPGHDDAVAIELAGKHPAIDLLGITVVSGNQTLDKTLNNALHLVQHLGLDVPVYAGCGIPMIRQSQVIADDIHGKSGLDGPVFSELEIEAEKEHAVQFIVETLRKSDGDITLVPTGPLTNIAMAMRLAPDIVPKIKEIVLMGGAYQLGNTTPVAEFNIYVDAEAAHVVFESGAPIVMMGLDLTRQALCYPSIVERMRKIDNKASKLFSDMMGFFNETQKRIFGWDGAPLHDPTCIAYLINPDCVETKDMRVKVEIRSENCYGQTICDFYNVNKEEPNAKVGVKLNTELFWDILEEGLRQYD